jgi:Chaperone of endosialidase
MKQYITKKIIGGVVFALAVFGTTILAVAISGTITTWTTGQVLKSSDLNTTITSLKTAIEGIPNWTKAANGKDAYYTAGNVGIGTTSPTSRLDLDGGELRIRSGNTQITYFGQDGNKGYIEHKGNNTTTENFVIQSSRSGDGTNYTHFIIDPTSGFSFMSTGTGNNSVGIGTASPSQLLTVNGNAGNTTGVWVNNSDERLKKNIQPLGNFLEKLTELRPVTFEWKDPKKLNAKEGKHIGFIAQEVEYWVDTDKDGMKWLSMEGVNAAFVQSFKEVALRLRSVTDLQQAEKTANEKKLLALEEDNKRLRETVETHSRASLRLEDRLRAIENLQMARK